MSASNETKVVCLKRSGGKIVQGCDIYIGRRLTMGGWDLKDSKWKNPFAIDKKAEDQKAERKKVIDKYEKYIRGNKKLLNDIEELRGKVLGCWCKKNGKNIPCHGDVLVKLLNEKIRVALIY